MILVTSHGYRGWHCNASGRCCRVVGCGCWLRLLAAGGAQRAALCIIIGLWGWARRPTIVKSVNNKALSRMDDMWCVGRSRRERYGWLLALGLFYEAPLRPHLTSFYLIHSMMKTGNFDVNILNNIGHGCMIIRLSS